MRGISGIRSSAILISRTLEHISANPDGERSAEAVSTSKDTPQSRSIQSRNGRMRLSMND